MYKISDFSKITSLSVKALRYYDEENLLTPSGEIYIKGPGMIFRGNENSCVTEIVMPYEEVL